MRKTSWVGRSLSRIRTAPGIRTLRKHPDLETVASMVGLVAILIVIIIVLVPLPSGRPAMTTSAPLSVASPEFLKALSGVVGAPVEQGGPVTVYHDTKEFEPALLDSIQNAKSTIDIADFIWWNGTFSDTVFDALIDAQRRGISVRVLVDAQGAKLPDEKVKTLESLGGEVEIFRKTNIFTADRLNKRMHRRAFIFDGATAYLGGVAIADDWLRDGFQSDKWHDMMFEVHGTMASDVQRAFADPWYETTGEVLGGEQFFPAAQSGSVPFISIATDPAQYHTPIEYLYLLSIRSAHSYIYITNPYFLPDREMRDALDDAAKRGVDVRILVPASGFSPVHNASETIFGALLEAGVKIYEYPGLLHAKTLVADDAWSIIGSANLDNRSRSINEENDLGVADRSLATSVKRTFAEDTSISDQVTNDEWNKEKWLHWIPSHLSLIFEKQY